MLLFVVVVIFFATLTRSALGFGEALLSVPLLAMCMPVKVAVPLAALVSITIAALVVAQDWRDIQVRSASWLVVSTLAGIPLGLWLLTTVAEALVKGLLAIIIIAFAAYCLRRRRPPALHDDKLAWCFGLGAGVLGGAYGMNGPPLVVYGTLRGWSPSQFRATLQGYFLPASLVGMAGYALSGLWVPAVTHYYLLSLGPMLLAVVLGRAINRRLDTQRFTTTIHSALIAVGAILLLQAL
ncbi:MAG TPA: sulfite exporter TauE/SafE family protein [Kofleriaceae bacterium]|nr:sulfite exporter TauE/SafE family protein [Kofleriaceae bacterium]